MVWRKWITQRRGGRGQLGEAKEIEKQLERRAWINRWKGVQRVEVEKRVGGHREEMRKRSPSLLSLPDELAAPMATNLIRCETCIPQERI